MPLARSWAVALVGVEGHLVEVEADLADGLPGVSLVGLPDTALHEARDRVRAAVVNSGHVWPSRRITLGLSPAALPKAGSGFDLAIAAAVLAAAGVLPAQELHRRVLLGELALDGRVRPVPGVLPAVLSASRRGPVRVVVPQANAAEAGLVPGVVVEPVGTLSRLIRLLRGEGPPDPPEDAGERPATGGPAVDLAQVAGQVEGRRVVEVAAAGGHHLFLVGPPGCGKTMLVERMPGLLPALTEGEALEVTAVHSVAGALPPDRPLLTRPPFRAPHHSATVAAVIGGGSPSPRPGQVSLAHRGVLFLDEAPEFAAGVLDSLRQPLESGVVQLARARANARYPARFTLALAANPCPCAADGSDPAAGAPLCTCTSLARRRYLARLSGPLLDRVDLRVRCRPPTRGELLADRDRLEASAVVASRVLRAREAAARRLAGTPWRSTAEVPGPELRDRWPLPSRVLAEPTAAFERGTLTARGLDRVLRVAWTLADLAGRDRPGPAEVGEAMFLRHGVAA
jgi:magnesium chelatase family protein